MNPLPKFKCDYEDIGTFLGHYFDHDIWLVKTDSIEESIACQYSDRDCDYASSPIAVLRDGLLTGRNIWLQESKESVNYLEWVFSAKNNNSSKCFLIGLLLLDNNA